MNWPPPQTDVPIAASQCHQQTFLRHLGILCIDILILLVQSLNPKRTFGIQYNRLDGEFIGNIFAYLISVMDR